MQSSRYSCQILMKRELYRQILKSTQVPNFMKNRPVGAEVFHVVGQTDIQT